MYYIPGSRESTERGKRLLMQGYYLQVPEGALASVLVDDQERQQSKQLLRLRSSQIPIRGR